MKVQILLSTYNGAKYLDEQIESILEQKDVDFEILVRDDGSSDTTKDILTKYSKYKNFSFYFGENIGVINSYFDLIANAGNFDYYAFCDQDDVCESDKLKHALNILALCDNPIKLYHSNVTIVDEALKKIPFQCSHTHSLSLVQALLMNNVVGCTMVISNQLLRFAQKHKPNYALMHDSWLALLCHVLGGEVCFDQESYILYRQHSGNVIGSRLNLYRSLIHSSLFANIGKRRQLLQEMVSAYSCFIDAHILNTLILFINYNTSKRAKLKLLKNISVGEIGFARYILFMFNLFANRY